MGWPGKRRKRLERENDSALPEEVKVGNEEGQRWCIGAKLSVNSLKKASQDATTSNCVVKDVGDDAVERQIVHHQPDTERKIPANYAFLPSCYQPTRWCHSERRSIMIRNGQYQWMLKALGLRKVDIRVFSRLDLVRTRLSTRKMTRLVKSGELYGWDDPRSTTIRGIRLCRVVVEALRKLVVSQGPSRNVVDMGLDRLVGHE